MAMLELSCRAVRGSIEWLWRVAARTKDAGHKQRGQLVGLGEGRRHLCSVASGCA